MDLYQYENYIRLIFRKKFNKNIKNLYKILKLKKNLVYH